MASGFGECSIDELAHTIDRLHAATLPALSEAFGEGRLSPDQVVPLARMARVDTDDFLEAEGSGVGRECATQARRARRVTAEAAEAHRQCGDGRAEAVAHGRGDAVVGVGRARRTVPPWLSGALRRRDGGTWFPGCEHRRWAHVHHIKRWVGGGPRATRTTS
jgi:hypothetical protein